MTDSSDSLANDVLRVEDLLQHEAWLRRFVERLVGDPGTAEDVVQETWLAALRARVSVRRTRAFLARIARNAAVSRARKVEARTRSERAAARAEATSSAAETVERLEAQQLVAAAISTLPEAERTAVILRHVHGMSPATIAERLDLDPATVRQRCHRGLDRVRARLEQKLGRSWRIHPGICALLGWKTVQATMQTQVAATSTAAQKSTAAGLAGSTLFTALMLKTKSEVLLGVAAALCACLIGGVGWQAMSSTASPAPSPLEQPADRVAALPTEPAKTTESAGTDSPRRSVVAESTNALTDAPSQAIDTVRIEVRDVRGTPIPDCTVFHVRGHYQPPNRLSSFLVTPGSRDRLGKTDSTGGLTVPGPEEFGYVEARHPDASQRWCMVYTTRIGGHFAGDPRTHQVVLAPAVRIEGIVRDDRPAPDHVSDRTPDRPERLRVELTPRDLVAFPFPLETGVRVLEAPLSVQPDQRFVIDNLAAGTLDLTFSYQPRGAEPVTLLRHAIGYVDQKVAVSIPPHESTTVRIEGFARTADGTPIDGARISIGRLPEFDAVHVVSDAVGRFGLDIAASSAEPRGLMARHRGLRPLQIEDLEPRIERALESGHPVAVDLVLEAGTDIHGRVIDSNGTPLGGLHVFPARSRRYSARRAADEMHGGEGPPLRLGSDEIHLFGTTTTQGRFTVPDAEDTTQRLRVVDANTGFSWLSEPVEPDRPNLTLELPSDRVRNSFGGRVVDRRGAGIPDVTISVATEVRQVGSASRFLPVATTTTGADGKFALPNLPRTELRFTLAGTGWITRHVISAAAAFAEADTRETEWLLDRRCFVRAALSPDAGVAEFGIVDAAGQPLKLVHQRTSHVEERDRQPVVRGQSPAVAVSGRAATALLYDVDGQLVGRTPLNPEPDRVVTIRR